MPTLIESKSFDSLEISLGKIYEYLQVSMIAELQSQGHSNTNTLINSVHQEIIRSTDFIQLNGMFVFYGKFVDSGRRAGARRVPIDVLEEWIKQKGFENDAKKIRGMAFAIQKTIFDKGISTSQSWKGEATKNWMTKVLVEKDLQIKDDVFNATRIAMELIISNIVRDTNILIQGNTIKL